MNDLEMPFDEFEDLQAHMSLCYLGHLINQTRQLTDGDRIYSDGAENFGG